MLHNVQLLSNPSLGLAWQTTLNSPVPIDYFIFRSIDVRFLSDVIVCNRC